MDARTEDWKELRELLRNAALNDWGPNGEVVEWRDKQGKAISVFFLKSVLKEIASYGSRAFPSLKTLEKDTGIRKRTIQRALQVLQAKDVLIVNQQRSPRGQKMNFYTILRPKLRLLSQDDRLPLMRMASQMPTDSATRPADEPSATWTSQAPPRPAMRHPEHTHAPPGGALTTQEEVIEAPSDVVGARWFDLEERAEIARLANQLGRWLTSQDPADRELVLKVATLQYDGRLSENAVGQLLESFELKAGEVGNRYAWLWQVLRNQCSQAGGKSFDSLLKTTDFPRELLAPRDPERQ